MMKSLDNAAHDAQKRSKLEATHQPEEEEPNHTVTFQKSRFCCCVPTLRVFFEIRSNFCSVVLFLFCDVAVGSLTPSNVTVQFTHKTSFIDPPQSEIYKIYSTIRRHGEKQAALVFYKDEVSGTPGAAGALSHLWERSATASGGLQVHNIQTKAAAGVREVIHLRLNIQLLVMPVGDIYDQQEIDSQTAEISLPAARSFSPSSFVAKIFLLFWVFKEEQSGWTTNCSWFWRVKRYIELLNSNLVWMCSGFFPLRLWTEYVSAGFFRHFIRSSLLC